MAPGQSNFTIPNLVNSVVNNSKTFLLKNCGDLKVHTPTPTQTLTPVDCGCGDETLDFVVTENKMKVHDNHTFIFTKDVEIRYDSSLFKDAMTSTVRFFLSDNTYIGTITFTQKNAEDATFYIKWLSLIHISEPTRPY